MSQVLELRAGQEKIYGQVRFPTDIPSGDASFVNFSSTQCGFF